MSLGLFLTMCELARSYPANKEKSINPALLRSETATTEFVQCIVIAVGRGRTAHQELPWKILNTKCSQDIHFSFSCCGQTGVSCFRKRPFASPGIASRALERELYSPFTVNLDWQVGAFHERVYLFPGKCWTGSPQSYFSNSHSYLQIPIQSFH